MVEKTQIAQDFAATVKGVMPAALVESTVAAMEAADGKYPISNGSIIGGLVYVRISSAIGQVLRQWVQGQAKARSCRPAFNWVGIAGKAQGDAGAAGGRAGKAHVAPVLVDDLVDDGKA